MRAATRAIGSIGLLLLRREAPESAAAVVPVRCDLASVGDVVVWSDDADVVVVPLVPVDP
jgi:hypothetical protein